MRRFYHFAEFEPRTFEETDDDTFPIFELQEAYAITGEEITYGEAAERYCESKG